jgi:4-amino-4-deoxy-L-arabinose transferase-like glycosyltransferase
MGWLTAVAVAIGAQALLAHGSRLGVLAYALAGGLVVALHLRRASPARDAGNTAGRRRRVAAAGLAVLLTAGLLRLPALERIPPGLNIDSAYNGIATLNVMSGDPYTPFTSRRYGRETLGYYYTVPFFLLWGPGIKGLRLASATLGVGACLAAFWFALRRFGLIAALGAGLFLASSPLQITFSRTANTHNSSPLLVMLLASSALLTALDRRRSRDFWVTGALLGLGLHTYKNFKYFLPLPVLFAIVSLLRRRGQERRMALRGSAALFAGFSLVALPMLVYAWRHPTSYFFREASILHYERGDQGILAYFWSNLLETLRSFHWGATRCGVFFHPGKPFLKEIEGALVLLGLVLLLLRALPIPRGKPGLLPTAALAGERRAAQYLLLWAAITIAVGTASVPNATHVLTIWGPFAVAAGLVLRELHYALAGPQGARKQLAGGTLVLLLGGMTSQGAWDYFIRAQRDPAILIHYNLPGTAVARYVREISATHQVFLSPFFSDHDCVRFLNYERSGYAQRRLSSSSAGAFRTLNPALDLPLYRPECRPTVVIVSSREMSPDLVERFRAVYPGVEVEVHDQGELALPYRFTVFKLQPEDFPEYREAADAPPGETRETAEEG